MDDELQAKESSWEQLLERAEGLLSGDPFSALDWEQQVALEVESSLRDHPEARVELAMLAQRTQSLIELTEQTSRRMLDESAERQRSWHLRELQAVATPTRELRRPWPPPERHS